MHSLHRWNVVSVLAVLLGAAVACSDGLTTPQAKPEEALLPQLTLENGSTLTLIGTDLVSADGKRMSLSADGVKNFRAVAAAAPKVQALAKQMKPTWAKMGLPDPGSPQASIALAAYRARSAPAVNFDVIALSPLAPAAPGSLGTGETKPTLVAECDPVYTFCGFDTGDPEYGGGGGAGGGSGSGTGGGSNTPFCISMSIKMYEATNAYFAASAAAQAELDKFYQCQGLFPYQQVPTCSMFQLKAEAYLLAARSALSDAQSYGNSLRAFQCI